MKTITWKGEPGGLEENAQHGMLFRKGEPVKIDDDHPILQKVAGNKFYDVDEARPEPVRHTQAQPQKSQPKAQARKPHRHH